MPDGNLRRLCRLRQPFSCVRLERPATACPTPPFPGFRGPPKMFATQPQVSIRPAPPLAKGALINNLSKLQDGL
jgi:hypothetical protein